MVSWIETHWNALATFAWRNYVAAGRGLVILEGAWDDDVRVGYQTPAIAKQHGHTWSRELLDGVGQYGPSTDIVFLVSQKGSGILLGMTTTEDRLPPHLARRADDEPPLVPSAYMTLTHYGNVMYACLGMSRRLHRHQAATSCTCLHLTCFSCVPFPRTASIPIWLVVASSSTQAHASIAGCCSGSYERDLRSRMC